MKLYLAATTAVILAAGAPAALAAPALNPDPVKTCYRDREPVNLLGGGFTPNGAVTIARNGVALSPTLKVDSAGSFLGQLQLAQGTGQSRRTYTATDSANPMLVAETALTVSAVVVNVRPDTGTPGKVLRIGARGFTDGTTLYAHIVRKKKLRTVRIGRLQGGCAKLVARKRLFAAKAPLGTYRVQFDTKRKYARDREVKYGFTVVVSMTAEPAAAAAGLWRPDRG